jgi:hypothetical protein
MRMRLKEPVRGRGSKLQEGSKRFAFTVEGLPPAPVTGGTKGQITGGFIVGDERRYQDFKRLITEDY